MLKIMTTPDTVKSSAEEMTEVLINYSKQRWAGLDLSAGLAADIVSFSC
jgi:hypothetical protein